MPKSVVFGVIITLLLITVIRPIEAAQEQTGLTVSIYTDKYTYYLGDTMRLGVNATNSDGERCVFYEIWIKVERNGRWALAWLMWGYVVLPAGLDYANPSFKTFTLTDEDLIPCMGIWHIAFRDTTTHKIIVEDTAEWELVQG